jgi:hypothetical protein
VPDTSVTNIRNEENKIMNESNTCLPTPTKPATLNPMPCSTAPPNTAPQAKPLETKPEETLAKGVPRKVRFEMDVPKARSVSVVGTFNNWTPGATRLVFIGGRKWIRELNLAPGRYEYRFVVDDKWMDPPNAKAYVPNPGGGRNAVVEV